MNNMKIKTNLYQEKLLLKIFPVFNGPLLLIYICFYVSVTIYWYSYFMFFCCVCLFFSWSTLDYILFDNRSNPGSLFFFMKNRKSNAADIIYLSFVNFAHGGFTVNVSGVDWHLCTFLTKWLLSNFFLRLRRFSFISTTIFTSSTAVTTTLT